MDEHDDRCLCQFFSILGEKVDKIAYHRCSGWADIGYIREAAVADKNTRERGVSTGQVYRDVLQLHRLGAGVLINDPLRSSNPIPLLYLAYMKAVCPLF